MKSAMNFLTIVSFIFTLAAQTSTALAVTSAFTEVLHADGKAAERIYENLSAPEVSETSKSDPRDFQTHFKTGPNIVCFKQVVSMSKSKTARPKFGCSAGFNKKGEVEKLVQ